MYSFLYYGGFVKSLLVLLLVTSGCSKVDEPPLTLPAGAEPSAKMRNDIGIEHYRAGRNFDALLQFNQANLADPTSGEIHFNLGLTLLNENEKEKALKNFKLAREKADGNPEILESRFLIDLLGKGP